MSSLANAGPFVHSEDTGDDYIDSFQLPVQFTKLYTEHSRRVANVSRGIRNAVHIQSWSRVKELGRGGFGTVYLETEKDGFARAVKAVQKETGHTRTLHYIHKILAMAHFGKDG